MIKTSTNESLEQSFFQLAYDRLQDSLKNLLPFLVGFEIIKKNDEGTKALGVFGFKSSKGNVLYVPAFFVNGKVKNLNLLYSKTTEQFFPLSEDFAQLFLKDDATGIGSASGENRSNILRDTPQGDYRQLAVPPRTGKYSIASVVDYVKSAGVETKQTFKNLIEKDAEFCEALLRFYPLEKIAEAIADQKGKKYRKNTKVDVIYKNEKNRLENLAPEDKESLLTRGFLVLDSRKNEEKALFGDLDSVKKFQNPTASGFYPYLTKSGSLNYALILVRPKQLQQGFSTDDSVVINLDTSDKGMAYICDTSKVFVKDQIAVKDYSVVHKMMVDAADTKPGFSSTYVLINENLKATQPFRITANFKDANGIRRLNAEPYSCYCGGYDIGDQKGGPKDRPGSVHGLPRGNYYEHPKKIRDLTLVFTKRSGESFTYGNNCVYIPSGYKLLEVKFHPHDFSQLQDVDDAEQSKKFSTLRENFEKNKPGDSFDLNSFLSQKNIFPMTVRSNGSEFFVDVAGVKKTYDDPIKAKIGMLLDFGLDYNQGEQLIDKVSASSVIRGHIKKAYTGDSYPQPYEENPYSNALGQTTYAGIGQENRNTGDISYTGDPTQLGLGTLPEIAGVDSSLIRQAVQLAESGQKEIFDTHTIASLAKHVSVDDKILDYVPSLIEAVDRLGRIIFLLNWDTDEFIDLYGRADLTSLSELINSVFKNLGELVIFLKRRSPELTINMDKDEV
jgi:hypothetical protein